MARAAAKQTRARSAEDKEARAGVILDAGLEVFRDTGFAGLTMAEVAKRAGLAKGTVFLYFATKEALGLALTERLLSGWFDDVDRRLERNQAPCTPEEVARLVARSVEGHDQLVALLSVLGSILEHNVEAGSAAAFKRTLLARATATGERIERVLPFLQAGDGLRVLLLVNALVVGLHQMAGHAPVVRRLLESPEFRVFRVDFPEALAEALRTHLEGLRVLRGAGGTSSSDE
jgi:AcrR family transcriptional regulator